MNIDRAKISEIKSREDFIDFVEELSRLIKGGEEIENGSVGAYLGGIASWVEDMDGYYENMGISESVNLESMNWRVLADILVAATMYE
ncbi:hypothetical protein AB4851_27735 [Burkholderia sp. 22PA0099]|uniref:DUF7660 family protein n=1 Tax=Burkholderia sp. 22PA0099 TaxID=3237372 RepID=UPI0039C3BA18